ncbi:hypothetical protein ACFL1C_03740 [Pseudomonadota bacterium]
MITLERQHLVIRFPEVHEHAMARISFQRTLRIPDDGRDYPLPPGMGEFPLHHVEDYLEKLPAAWAKHGGVFMPMYQSEALWLSFDSGIHDYPIAIQVAAGKINAVNGEPWQEELQFDPQGYIVSGQQPWLDGFCIEKGRIRQFVAAPLGEGITVEEQLTGEGVFGGIQIKAWPLKAKVYEDMLLDRPAFLKMGEPDFMMCCENSSMDSMDMGLGMGGSMKQEIYDDHFKPHQWETEASSRCYVHLLNSVTYSQVTGHLPPHRPYEAADYAAAGLPWFDYYSDQAALEGSDKFAGLKTWKDFQEEKIGQSVNVEPKNVVHLSDKPGSGRPVSQGDLF